jgi:hypothetical protein
LHQPIIISGFGRSGTTWVSDIISKSLGGIILFEPDHPIVFDQSIDFLYAADLSEDSGKELIFHLNQVFKKKKKNPWLLRNHLSTENELSSDFMNMIWNESRILGYKVIRWNHLLPELYSQISKRIIFIIRHPLAVVSSLIKRKRFFEEFGFERHWSHFKKKNPLKSVDLNNYENLPLPEKFASMWAVSNIKALESLSKMDLPFFQYEKIYTRPYIETRKMLKFLGYSDTEIHPSYLFYPSMSTLKTYHTLSADFSFSDEMPLEKFWSSSIDTDEANRLINIVKEIAINHPAEYDTFHTLGYLDVQ